MRHIEQLENRCLFSTFTAASVAELVADMNAANAAGGANTITLAAAATFNLNAVDNNAYGPNGLPTIASGDDLTIVGNGDTIQRSTGKGTPAFRLFAVVGGSLTLNNLTLSNGLAIGSYAWGGAILSLGTLSLNHVTVQGSVAQGQLRNGAYGGGVFSNGLLAVANSTIQSNQALGGDGYFDQNLQGGGGGQALGGGLYVGGGTATLTNTTLSSNLAQGGAGANGGQIKLGWFKQSNAHYAGGPGGNGYGGGIFVGAGTLDLTGTTITQNAARGGIGGNSPAGRPKGADGIGQGGGIYIAPAASVGLDFFTQAHTTGNSASTSDNDIFGGFTVLG